MKTDYVATVITTCSMRHLYASEPSDSIVIEHAKTFERRRCNHHELEKPLSEFDCLTSVLDPKGNKTNKFRYVVASDNEKVRAYMRTVPGVPLVYLKRSVMIMEPMAASTAKVAAQEERSKHKLGLKDQRSGPRGMKRGLEDDDEDDQDLKTGNAKADPSAATVGGNPQPPKKRRKRGPSGPNPLSVKKSKPSAGGGTGPSAKRSVKRREEVSTTTGTDATTSPSIPTTTGTPTEGPGDNTKKKRKRKHTSTKLPAEGSPAATAESP